MKRTSLVLSLSVLASLAACSSSATTVDAGGDVPADDVAFIIDRPFTRFDGCVPQTCNAPPGCRYVPSVRRVPAMLCECGDLVCDDAGTDAARDAPADVCMLTCPPPPPMCRYEGPVTCSPPSCGRVVCPDAGVPPPDVTADVAADVPRVDASAIVCGASGGGSFPTFSNVCMADGDCVVAVHQTDCCGNMRALGINRSQRAAFDAAEAICRPMYPGCGCPSRGIETDDMRFTFSAESISARCAGGRCTTALPTP